MKPVKGQHFFISFYFISYIGFAFLMTNYTPFLSSIGYDARYRGYILSGYAITTILFQLLFGIVSDRFQTIKKIVVICLGVMGIAAGLLFSNMFSYIAIHFLLIALTGGLVNACCGMYDTWLLGSNEHLKNSMSFIKAFGSIGWALGSILASRIIIQFSYLGLGVALIILVILMEINLLALSDINKIARPKETKKDDLIQLFRNRNYCLLLVVLFFMYSMVVTNNCTVVDKMLELGANNQQISMKWSLQSLLEIPTYIAGAILLKKFSSIKLLRFSSFVIVVQFIMYGLATTVGQIIMISAMQIFTTPLIMIASKMIIFDITPKHLRNSSQLIALSVFIGSSSLLIPSIAGTISVNLGYNFMLFMAAFLGVVSFLLIPKFSGNSEKKLQ